MNPSPSYHVCILLSTVLVTSKLLNIVTYLAIQQCRTRSNSRRVNVQVELQQQLINLLRTAIQISTFVGILLGLGVTTTLLKPIFKNEGEPISKYWLVFVAKLFGVLAWKGEKSPNDPITKCTYQFIWSISPNSFCTHRRLGFGIQSAVLQFNRRQKS